jgi:hypothetical protein
VPGGTTHKGRKTTNTTGGTGNKATGESTQKREQAPKSADAVRMHTEGGEITNNNREQRGQGERRHREKEGEETTRSNHQLRKRREKKKHIRGAQQRPGSTRRHHSPK